MGEVFLSFIWVGHFGRITSFDRDIIESLLISGWGFMPLEGGISEISDGVQTNVEWNRPI